MTAVLLWKEYRQQRAFWLSVAFLALLLVLSLAETLGRGSLWQVFHDESIGFALTGVLVCLCLAYGVVSGALLLAGESDEGTLVFLDNLAGRRGPLFIRKLLAGVILTLSLCLFLAALALALGFGSWEIGLVLPLLGLDGLMWGLLAGALCRKVLIAGLTGIAFMAASWPLAFGPMIVIYEIIRDSSGLIASTRAENLALFLAKVILDSAAGYASWRIYCRDDRTRRTATPFFWRVLFWLSFRQGRWILAAGLAGAVLLGVLVNLEPLIFWPIGSLLLGLTFGLAVFAPDQDETNRFLGIQRLPPGRIWILKILFWGVALLVLTILAWFGGAVYHGQNLSNFYVGSGEESSKWMFLGVLAFHVSPCLLVGLWPLYGFCFGQFFGQVVRRPILASIFALFLTPLVVAAWVPSLLFGGLSIWQVLLIPILLLTTTRLTLWPWVSGRLWSARPLLGIAGVSAFMVLSLIGCLWYRVVEVPDIGEPFDVSAFIASLPSPEENEAGRLIRKASVDMKQQREQVEKQLFQEGDVAARTEGAYTILMSDVLATGWPMRAQENGNWQKELSRWLDRLFAGTWVQDAEKAARLPPGMVQDPRLADRNDSFQDYQEMARLFVLRALQLQAHGDSRGALNHLDTVLALSRQVRNNASHPLFGCGHSMETIALSGFRHWLQNSDPDKELLRAALTVLQRHEAALPDPANTIKAEYLAYRSSDPHFIQYTPLVHELLGMAYQVPGEKDRNLRLVQAIVAGQLRAIQEPYWQIWGPGRSKTDKSERYAHLARWTGLPPKEGSGSQLTANRWGELVSQFGITKSWHLFDVQHFAAMGKQSLYAAELAAAVTLYQAEHGKPPNQLSDLVPGYLATVPDDPYTGQPFRYGISTGEIVDGGSQRFKLAPGQAFVKNDNSVVFYPIPVWTRMEDKP